MISNNIILKIKYIISKIKKRISIKQNNKEIIINKKYLKDIKTCNIKLPLYFILEDKIYKPYILYKKNINLTKAYDIYIIYNLQEIIIGELNLINSIYFIAIFIPIYNLEHLKYIEINENIKKELMNIIID